MVDEHVQVYHKNTLKNMRAALNRHIKDLNRNFDIVHVSDFRTSNIIYDSTLKMIVKTRLSRPTKHKEIIDLQDLQLINAYLNNNAKNPVLLRLRFWFNLAIHFVSRGLEFHHQLNLNSFDFHVDAEGDEYTTISHETQQKKIQGGIMCAEAPADKFLYGNAVDQNVCPVASLKMFISKTDPNAKSLFNRCIKDLNVNDAVWYTCQPLAKRTYSGFMTDLFKQAKCSKIYTAHCLRATAIQKMNDAGHEHRNIMFLTGHKNEASIRSYNHHCSVQPKKFQSATSTRHSHAWKFQTLREYSKLPYTCTVQIIYCFF
jgi:hypothetical protein